MRTQNGLVKAIDAAIASLVSQRRSLDRQIDDLESKRKVLGGKSPRGARTDEGDDQPTVHRAKKKRIRRSPEQLKALAGEIVEFVRAKKDGVSGIEIKKRFGAILPSTKDFVSKFGGVKFKSTGAGIRTLYFA